MVYSELGGARTEFFFSEQSTTVRLLPKVKLCKIEYWRLICDLNWFTFLLCVDPTALNPNQILSENMPAHAIWMNLHRQSCKVRIEIVAYLVGGLNPSENMKVNWDDYSQYMGTFKKWPPNHQPAYSCTIPKSHHFNDLPTYKSWWSDEFSQPPLKNGPPKIRSTSGWSPESLSGSMMRGVLLHQKVESHGSPHSWRVF